MLYCQDCGATNDTTTAICRICGQMLVREPGAEPCPACAALVADGAAFCSLCGASTVDAVNPLRPELAPASLKIEAVVAAERHASAARIGSMLHLGEGLDLPDWLHRAAAEQPPEPRATARTPGPAPSPPLVFAAVLEPFTASEASGAKPPGAAAVAESAASASSSALGAVSAAPPAAPVLEQPTSATAGPRAALPQAGLTNGMPSWLRAPLDASAPPSELRPSLPAPPSAEMTDTSSFISENDLPDWIRRLAAADEAKRAEEARLTAESDDPPFTAGGGRPPARRSRSLPGETPAATTASNPWLARRERAAAPDAPGTGWSTQPTAVPGATTPAKDETQLPEVTAATAGPGAVPQTPQPAAVSEPAAKQHEPAPMRRYVLIAAVVLVVVALLAFVLLGR